MKASFKIKEYKNKSIKVGDIVRVFDGSGLTSFAWNNEKEVYIILEYPRLTGINLKLKDIDAEVLETNVKDYVCNGAVNGYIQDLVIRIGDEKFRTCSGFVTKVK